MIKFNGLTIHPNSKNLSEDELKKLRKDGKIQKCPTRKAAGSKNARWGQVGR
tara:strand:- start:425 stop:580 length:156 start_codon:yes stop_codon:yes gene_type:complete